MSPRAAAALRERPVNIVGAGLAGPLLAVLLARRGFTVRLFDRRTDPRQAHADRGRSINLALAARGIRALERAGLMERIRPLLIAMPGRMLHERSGATVLVPYGQREHEVNYSVGRAALNRTLIEAAAACPGVTLHFGHVCLETDPARNLLRIRERDSRRIHELELGPTIAADGAGSTVRSSLHGAGLLQVREEPLDHDYKELGIPPRGGRHALEPHALHVWPRGGFMLIALPNPDSSFTATLFLAREGEAASFAALASPDAVLELFRREFPDVVPLMPNLAGEFFTHPQSPLGTVHAWPWHIEDKVLLLGDAAHAMVPFHGQGMNAAFEDCVMLDELLERHADWGEAFAAFEALRRPDAAAIAQMALENYIEMRATVLDPKFQRQKQLSLELERRHPERFIPRYAMVMFHPEIPYAEALRRGAVQTQILDELDAAAQASGRLDLEQADRLVTERLAPLAAA